jgi:hypothetical protein
MPGREAFTEVSTCAKTIRDEKRFGDWTVVVRHGRASRRKVTSRTLTP